ILSFIYGQLGYMYLGLLACGSLIGRFASTGLRRNLSLIVKIVLKSAALSVSMYAAVLYIIYRINGFVMIGYTKYPKSPNDPIPARTWFDDYASYNTVEYVFFNMLRISWRGIAFGSILGIACFICEILGIKTLRIEDKRRFYFIAAGGFAAYSVVFYGGWYSVNYFGELGRQLLPLIVMSVLAALLLTFEGLGFARQFYLNRRTAEAAR
ncbi:MAG: hypothetical protein NT027_05335, partial [Proteobacteria bacterium]|nr:hypothetical protein [Pseudomonadota bacterium]